MSKFSLLLLCCLIFSCRHDEPVNNECELTYDIIIGDNEQYCEILKSGILDKIKSNKDSKEINLYNEFTQVYLDYLDSVESDIRDNSSEIFFDRNGQYSTKGKKFIHFAKMYSENLKGIVKDENILKRLNFVLNTNDVEQPNIETKVAKNNFDNNIIEGKVYFRYLDYYYNGLTNNQILALLSNKRKSILELESEYILSEANNR
jgi:hypothetical protein